MKLFGTDGLRGTAGVFPLDPASLRVVGREVARRIRRSSEGRVIIGGDTRESTEAMIAELSAGIREGGGAAENAGVVPTPAVAELVAALPAGAGISVSASHNPYEDNGIKIFGPDAKKWPDAEEEALEATLLAARSEPASSGEQAPSGPPPDPALAERYLRRLAGHAPARLSDLSVLLDAGNGAAHRLGPEALRRAGACVRVLCGEPDGRNINADCGALHPQRMARETRQTKSAMGVAFDGDADRSIFADETGRILDGDDVLWILARDWNEKGTLPPAGVVGTVMSNYGLEAALTKEGIPFHRAAVGDRHVARKMNETGAGLGGETSGHILQRLSPSGDGILTALLLAGIVTERGLPLSALATLTKMPQALRNIRVAKRVPLADSALIAGAVARAEEALARRGRVFLRYSGTEPLLRILVEGPDEEEVAAIAADIEAAAREALV